MKDDKFRHLAVEVQDILQKYEIDSVGFDLNIRVTEDYYSSPHYQDHESTTISSEMDE